MKAFLNKSSIVLLVIGGILSLVPAYIEGKNSVPVYTQYNSSAATSDMYLGISLIGYAIFILGVIGLDASKIKSRILLSFKDLLVMFLVVAQLCFFGAEGVIAAFFLSMLWMIARIPVKYVVRSTHIVVNPKNSNSDRAFYSYYIVLVIAGGVFQFIAANMNFFSSYFVVIYLAFVVLAPIFLNPKNK